MKTHEKLTRKLQHFFSTSPSDPNHTRRYHQLICGLLLLLLAIQAVTLVSSQTKASECSQLLSMATTPDLQSGIILSASTDDEKEVNNTLAANSVTQRLSPLPSATPTPTPAPETVTESSSDSENTTTNIGGTVINNYVAPSASAVPATATPFATPSPTAIPTSSPTPTSTPTPAPTSIVLPSPSPEIGEPIPTILPTIVPSPTATPTPTTLPTASPPLVPNSNPGNSGNNSDNRATPAIPGHGETDNTPAVPQHKQKGKVLGVTTEVSWWRKILNTILAIGEQKN